MWQSIPERDRERVGRNVAIWIVTELLILVCVPVLHYQYLENLLDYEYANGLRTSTAGDTIAIPLVGGFVFLVLVLSLINVVGACYLYLRYMRVRD